jgi:hypothetical protein
MVFGITTLIRFTALTPLAAVYAIVVRSSEYDLPPEMLDDIISRSLPSLTSGSGKAKRGRDAGSDDEHEDVY